MSPSRRMLTTRPTPDPYRAGTWLDQAACAGVDPRTFELPLGGKWDSPDGWEIAREAKAWCDRCPVRTPCLAGTGAMDDTIRGGLTPKERRPVNAQRQTMCRNGHDTSEPESRYANGGCKACAREKAARYRLANQERTAVATAAYIAGRGESA
jgi:hypothetical protein